MKAAFLSHLEALPQPPSSGYPGGTPFVHALAHGTMTLELFAPATSGLGRDIQQPHAQDELYVVQRGHASFRLGDGCLQAGPGDALFVPAGVPHRFENFSDDFVTWVIFFGPHGGER